MNQADAPTYWAVALLIVQGSLLDGEGERRNYLPVTLKRLYDVYSPLIGDIFFLQGVPFLICELTQRCRYERQGHCA